MHTQFGEEGAGPGGTNTATVTAPAKKPALKKQASGLQNATAAAGMGGVGKTMMAAALVRDEEVLAAFQKICWVSVGQEPDMLALQNTLHYQLTSKPLPEDAKARATFTHLACSRAHTASDVTKHACLWTTADGSYPRGTG